VPVLEDMEDAGDGEENGECGGYTFFGAVKVSARLVEGSGVHIVDLEATGKGEVSMAKKF